MTAALAIEALPSPWSNRGVSREAQELRDAAADVRHAFTLSVVLSKVKHESISSLMGALIEARCDVSRKGAPVAFSKDSLHHAIRLIESLPNQFPAPEFGVDPDGEIALDWYVDKYRALSISVAASGVLSYAAILGKSTKHGSEELGDDIPKEIVDSLRRLFQG